MEEFDPVRTANRLRPSSFPHFSTILSNPTPPANPFPPPTCTPPSQFATSIRITNKLSLTSINYCTTLSFELADPSSPMDCAGLTRLPPVSVGPPDDLFSPLPTPHPP